MVSDQARPQTRRCARCGTPTRADRMVKGFGAGCARFLGLTGGTVDVGQDGPDLFDMLHEDAREPAESAVDD